VFDERPSPDVFLATESEVVRSESLLRRVRDDLRLDALAADAITVERRPGTMILDISVANKDPAAAAMICNRVIQAYVESRLERSYVDLATSAQAIAAELERRPDDADLKRKLADIDLQRTMRKSDVRVLEPCAMPAAR